MDNKHSIRCRYNNDSLMLYAYLELKEGVFSLISANEMARFEEFLELAHKEDESISIDMESNDTIPYKLVYGGLMIKKDITYEFAEASLKNSAGGAWIDVDSETNGNIKCSAYDAIKLYPEKAENEKWIPFVCLMKTHHVLHNEEVSVTMFPYTGGLVWELIVNKPFLLACRETVEIEELNTDNWEKYISEELLTKVYKVADLYIPK